MNMKKNILLVLGATALLASCSNSEVVDQQVVNVPKSDVAVSLGAESNIVIEQTRAVVEKWNQTPIYVWGLDNADGANWSNATSNLFSPASYVSGVVADATGNVKLGTEGEMYFYPLTSEINYSFYGASPIPNNNTLLSNSVTASYEITGNKDILWGEAVAGALSDGDKTYYGYNARYLRKGGQKPILKFEHKLTQLIFKGIKGKDEHPDAGSVQDVQIKNITVNGKNWATMTVAGNNKGQLVASNTSTESEIPAYFGDQTYAERGANVVLNERGADAGIVMLLPPEIGQSSKYTVNITLDAIIDGKTVPQPSQPVTITFKDKLGNELPFEAGKAYNVNLTVYGLREVAMDATVTDWIPGGTIDQEVN